MDVSLCTKVILGIDAKRTKMFNHSKLTIQESKGAQYDQSISNVTLVTSKSKITLCFRYGFSLNVK